MCGILGLYCTSPESEVGFKEALRLQEHRGPDETRQCFFTDCHFLLGANRLSILDFEHGSQPLQNRDGTIALSFNGEIFNAKELRQILSNEGVCFESDHSDTEVVLRGYIKYGLEFISMLNGMFAVVIIDTLQEKVIGIRDRFGIKPFHFFFDTNFFACSSELKPLLTLMKIGSKTISIDKKSVSEYLQIGFISAPQSIYSNVKVLEPGHYVEFDLRTKVTPKSKPWKQTKGNWGVIPEPELAQVVRRGFLEAVDRWTYSDHPLALSLSGGLDSTCILIASEILGVKLETFSLVFNEPSLSFWDESKNIYEIRRSFGTKHQDVQLSAVDLSQSITKIVRHLGQPYGGGLPSYRVFQEVSKSYRVCLTGTGGDELFGNYGRHSLIGESSITSQKSLDEHYTKKIYKTRATLLARIFRNLDFSQEINNWYFHFKFGTNIKLEERLEQLNLKTQLPDEFLFATDRLSMMYSVEARTPFLDNVFAGNVLSIDSGIRHRLPIKELLRSAFKIELDKLNLSAPKKGFSLPLSNWLRGDLREWGESSLNNPKLVDYLGVDLAALLEVYENFLSGNNDNILMLWRVMMFSAWLYEAEDL